MKTNRHFFPRHAAKETDVLRQNGVKSDARLTAWQTSPGSTRSAITARVAGTTAGPKLQRALLQNFDKKNIFFQGVEGLESKMLNQ